MTKHIVFRIVAGLVLLAVLASIAFFAFNAGVARGAASDVQLPAVPAEGLAYPHHLGIPFFGFGCLAPLAVLFLVCLAFASMRHMIWGPRWGWRHMGHHGPMGRGPWGEKGPGECVPPMFDEWHRRAHEKPEEPAEKKAE